MPQKNAPRALLRQMTVTGFVVCFIAIGVARYLNRAATSDLHVKVVWYGLVGFGIGVVIGVVMHQFSQTRMSRASHENENEKSSDSDP
ncbi:MAG: hypothetical protein AAGA96_08695 [Verrucomicrobiota bacterium]